MLKVLQIRRTCAHILQQPTPTVVSEANRAEAEGRGRGASLLKGSCNFHSRVLLKLVLRPRLPSSPVRHSTPQLPARSAARRLAPPFHTTSSSLYPALGVDGGLLACLRGCVSSDLSEHLYSTNENCFGCLRILIIVVDMVSIFFNAFNSWVSISSLYHFQNYRITSKKQFLLSTRLSVVSVLQGSDLQ
ncbi:hypothetical protein FQN60_000178 [Etheostoma spectabile]|uniref:Uncharacterized protein n=1 Tax=Etheostoma spectabile TaxID=54343 RepID=A0A5J5CVI2_9PERO|nr:hypothetical protein FQN60_000178 [Etheostoma spectabile]